MKSLESLVQETMDVIRNLPEGRHGLFVGFSGGKDSQVLLDLVRKSGKRHIAGYSVTGVDPPELVRFIRENYPDVKWLHPKETFWDGIRRRGPPRKFMRWCCDTLKKEPAERIRKMYPIQLVGVRAEESLKRSRYEMVATGRQRIVVRPLLHWKEWHVWEYLESRNLKACSLYEEGWHRIGCVVCPFITSDSGKHVEKVRERWPSFFKVFEKVVGEWFMENQRKRQDFHVGETVEDYLDLWYHDFYTRSAQKRRSVRGGSEMQGGDSEMG